MSIQSWKVYSEDTIACFLEFSEIREWLNNNLVIGPGEAAVIIKDGKIQETITEEQRKLGNWADRNLPTLKKWFGVEHDYRVLMIRTTPFDMPFTIKTYSLNKEEVDGEGILRCRVVTNQAQMIISLLGGQRCLSKQDLLSRLTIDLMSRVFQPIVGGALHDELRGNVQLLQTIESQAKTELHRILSAWGVFLDSFTIKWGLTNQEKAEIERKRIELEDASKEFQHTRKIRDLERDAEIHQMIRQLSQEDQESVLMHELHIKGVRVDAQISEEQKQALHHVFLAQVDADIADIETKKKIASLEYARAQDDLSIERKRRELALIKDKDLFEKEQDRLDFEMIQRNKRERMRVQQEHELEMLKTTHEGQRIQREQTMQQMAVQVGMMERLVSQGFATGASDSATLQEMLKQQTLLGAAYQGEGVAKSAFDAEAAKNNMDAYKQAEDRERQHQHEMTRLSSDMMQAAKQNPGQTVIAGGLATPPQPSINVVHAQGGGTAPSQPAAAQCPHCNQPIQAGWKACPACGERLGQSVCPECSSEIKQGWRACPACGKLL
jgi:hypothetical protein